jgi:tRNA A37 N6-isopentenylltransferase MiaA
MASKKNLTILSADMRHMCLAVRRIDMASKKKLTILSVAMLHMCIAFASSFSTLSSFEWHREIYGEIEDSRRLGELDLVAQPKPF